MTEYLSEKGVNFEEINIRTTPEAIDELVRLGVKATPALMIGDKVLVGFDPDEIDRAISGAR